MLSHHWGCQGNCGVALNSDQGEEASLCMTSREEHETCVLSREIFKKFKGKNGPDPMS